MFEPIPGKTAQDATKGMEAFSKSFEEAFDQTSQKYADRILAGEDPTTMGVPPSLREQVTQLVTKGKEGEDIKNETATDKGDQASELDFGSDISEVPAVAGVMFSRNAIRTGESGAEAGLRDVRLWMEEVAKQQFSTPEERLKAIGEAVQAATNGNGREIPQITHDQAAVILDEMGVTADKVRAAKEQETPTAEPAQELKPEQVKAMLAELEAQIGKLQSGSLSQEQFQQAVTELKDARIPKDQIAQLLEKHEIRVRSEGEAADEGIPSEPEEDEDQKPLLPSGKRATWLRSGVTLDENGDFVLGKDTSTRLARPGSQPMIKNPEDVSGNDFFGIHIPPEIDQKARLLEKQEGDSYSYLKHVGSELGWKKDINGDWIIPNNQLENLNKEEYFKLITWKLD